MACRSAALGVDHTEQVAFGIGEHHEVGAIRIGSIEPLGAKRDESLDFGPLLLRIGRPQFDVRAVLLVQPQEWAIAAGGRQHRVMTVAWAAP
jgi:hypothetical protein